MDNTLIIWTSNAHHLGWEACVIFPVLIILTFGPNCIAMFQGQNIGNLKYMNKRSFASSTCTGRLNDKKYILVKNNTYIHNIRY